MKRLTGIAVCSVLMAMQAWASDEDQFEIHADSMLGRVFMTPGERWELDRKRLSPPAARDGTAATPSKPDSPPPTREAMGYIVPHQGLPSAWQDGDFRRISDGRDPALISFPPGVRIIRHSESIGEIRSTEVDAPSNDNDSDAARKQGSEPFFSQDPAHEDF